MVFSSQRRETLLFLITNMAAVTLVKPAIADQHVPNNEIIAGCISAPVPILVSKVANWSFQLKLRASLGRCCVKLHYGNVLGTYFDP